MTLLHLLPLVVALSVFVGTAVGACGEDLDGDGYYSHDGSLACLIQRGGPADCDDAKRAANPASANPFCNCLNPPPLTEDCEAGAWDTNCDGTVDEGLWVDADGDGYSAPGASITCLGAGRRFANVADAEKKRGTDCDDSAIGGAARNPGLTEILCDGIDQDCQEGNDVSLVDSDGDGEPTAVPKSLASLCDGVAQLDCNDADARISHLLREDDFRGVQPDGTFGDGLDNNCDGIVDNGFVNNVRLALSGSIVDLENSRKRTIYGVEDVASSSSDSSSDSSCTNLLVELTLTNLAVRTDATNVIVEGKLQLPRGSLIKATVLGQLGRYGVKVDAKTGAITWVQFKLDKSTPGSLANSQTIQLPICSDDPSGPANVKLQVVRMDQINYDLAPAKLELRQ